MQFFVVNVKHVLYFCPVLVNWSVLDKIRYIFGSTQLVIHDLSPSPPKDGGLYQCACFAKKRMHESDPHTTQEGPQE